MASISQLTSEIVHALRQPNNKALRENVKSIIVHTRNELIRRSFENHNYVDKGLTQRYKVTLTAVNDGEITLPEGFDEEDLIKIQRTEQKVPKPVRLVNNLPFDRVSTVGFRTNVEIPFIKESSDRFRDAVPGLCVIPCYDYINGYIYIFPSEYNLVLFNKIVIESAFEHPTEIQLDNGEISSMDYFTEENEWLIPEDMVGQIKDIIFKRDLLDNIRETDELPNVLKLNS